MTFFHILLIVCILFLVSFGIGIFWTNYMENYQNSVTMSLIMGVITEFLFFHILAVPAIFMGFSLSALSICWGTGIIIFLIISLVLNHKRLVHLIRFKWKSAFTFMNNPNRGWIAIAIILVFSQTLLASFTWTGHQDDNRYVAVAVDAYETDTLLCYHPFTGEFFGEPKSELIKDAVAPINMLWASLSQIFHIHPTILMHSLLPLFFIPLCYLLYAVIAKKLMKNDDKKTSIFLIIFWLFNMLNHVTHHEGIGRLLFFIWWGKSLLTSLYIPLLILLLMDIMEHTKYRFRYLTLTFVLWSGCVTSIMSPIFLPLLTGSYALIDGIRTKKLSRFLLPIICCIPALAYGILYFLVKQV